MHLRKIVLRLAFAEQIAYRKNEGFRTPQVSVPFKFFDNILGNCEMAHLTGFDPVTSAFGENVPDWPEFDFSWYPCGTHVKLVGLSYESKRSNQFV